MKRVSFSILIMVCLSIVLSACSTMDNIDKLISNKPTESITTSSNPSMMETAFTQNNAIKQPEFAQRANMAFGLYSIGLPEGSIIKDDRNPILCQESYDITNPKINIDTNYAPLESYKDTASKKFDSMVSFFYVFLDPDTYSETLVKEEVLENGARIKWRIMKSKNSRCIIFEAFSKLYGYNFAILSSDPKVTDESLINMMYSFQYNEVIENNTISLKQTKTVDGTFKSVDNALKISLNAQWNECPQIMIEGCIMGLEWGDGKTLIQVFRYDDTDAEHQLDAFNAYINQLKERPNYTSAVWGKTESIKLENLDNIDAYIIEVYSNNDQAVISQNICFMYKGYCYIGMFMRIKPLDVEKRAEIEAAIHSLAPNK
jgi:hypothetical protein